MDEMRAGYDELYVYTMGRPGFILQHVVDAFAVQSAGDDSKPISVVFGLAGLYLHLEKDFSGRQVQKAHMEMGRKKRVWPTPELPADRGSITAADVLAFPPGVERDRAIDDWCQAVWKACSGVRATIEGLLQECEIV